MEATKEIVYYVYCITCDKQIFKGSQADALKVECKKNHNYVYGTLWYFDEWYPHLVLEE
jgi:hypothetical protein